MAKDKITVFLVDDQSLFRRGLRMGLAESEDVQVVGESLITDEVPELIESFSPHIVLIDASPPNHRGLGHIPPHHSTQPQHCGDCSHAP